MLRIVVVLPAPLGPRKPKISPRCTSRSRFFTAGRVPYVLESACVAITVAFTPDKAPRMGGFVTSRPQAGGCQPVNPGVVDAFWARRKMERQRPVAQLMSCSLSRRCAYAQVRPVRPADGGHVRRHRPHPVNGV